MRINIAVIVLAAAITGSLCVRCESAEEQSARVFPAIYTEKADSTSDLTQTDRLAELPGGGKTYCGPVAVSNSLFWLSENGFANLTSGLADRRDAHFELARTLGSKRYMNTSLRTGTGADSILDGVDRYLEDRGYEYGYLKFQGWRKHPGRFSSGVAVPELDWIKRGIVGDSGVWLNVGWYKYDSSSGEYARVGGHWVTLVGYGVDEKGRGNSDILIVHDPAPRCGKEPHEYVRMELIGDGRLTGKYSGLPRPAKGYYKMAGGMHVKKTADFAILDGVVVLRMPERVVNTRGQN
ncbi:MAG: hypothetical protein JW720_12130 [Sedimentisphaerales bacterium]|nr:hypothetical protein [Sedimentisphaerales bacterium]